MKTKCPLPKDFSGTKLVSGFLLSLMALSLTAVSAAVAAPFAYVSNAGSNSVSVIDGTTLLTTVPVGARPTGVAVNPARTRAYVFNQGAGTVSVIDLATNTVAATIVVGPAIPDDMAALGPGGIAVSGDNQRVYVANGANGTAAMIDVASNRVTSIATTLGMGPEPKLNGVVVVGTRAFFSDLEGHVFVVDGTSQIATITVGTEFSSRPMGIVAGRSSSVDRVYVVDLKNNFIEPTVLEVSVIDPIAIVPTVVATIPIEVDTMASPGGIAVSPDGNVLYVANDAQDEVFVVRLVGPATCWMPDESVPCVVARVGVGSLPFGVATDSTGTRVYAVNKTAGTVSVIDVESNTVLSTVTVGSSPSVLGAFVTVGPDRPDPGPNPNPTPAPPSCDDKIADLKTKAAKYGYYKHHNGYYKLKTALRLRAEATREIEKATTKVGVADARIVKAKKEFSRGDEALCANRYWRAAHEYWEAYEVAHRILKHHRYHRR
jgi:YVTN family beta-propeller protein